MRNVDLHDQLPRLTILPHVQFTDWIFKLRYKFGSFDSKNNGYILFEYRFLGIPCIGYIDSDPQRLCQPDLSVDLYDIEKRELDRLVMDWDFYDHCSKTA